MQAALHPVPAIQAPTLSTEPGKKRITLDELIERYHDDFEGFCGLLQIVDKSGKRVRLKFNPIQRKYNEERTARDVVLKPRQVGFTTLELARDIWFFLVKPGARVVTTCQTVEEQKALKGLSKVYRLMFESLVEEGVVLKFRTYTTSEWELADRDASLQIIEAGASEDSAQKKGRAGTITRLHLSETAFYEYAQQTLNAMTECVPAASHGTEIVNECTANGAAGVFYEDYKAASDGKSDYTAHFFPWFVDPDYATELEPDEIVEPHDDRQKQLVSRHGISLEQLKWYQHKLANKKSQELVDQEYPSDPETCFLISGRTFFVRVVTTVMHGATTDPIAVEDAGTFRIWKRPVPGRKYVVTADPSEGTGGDPGAAVVRDKSSGEHVATLHGQFPPWEMGRRLAKIGRAYNNALIVVERNNHGHAVLQALDEGEHYPNIFHDDDEKPGWRSTEISRTAALDALESSHREGEFTTPDVLVTSEMLVFVVNKKGKAEAAPGAHDDLVLAMAISEDVMSKAPAHIRAPQIKPNTRWGNAAGRGFG